MKKKIINLCPHDVTIVDKLGTAHTYPTFQFVNGDGHEYPETWVDMYVVAHIRAQNDVFDIVTENGEFTLNSESHSNPYVYVCVDKEKPFESQVETLVHFGDLANKGVGFMTLIQSHLSPEDTKSKYVFIVPHNFAAHAWVVEDSFTATQFETVTTGELLYEDDGFPIGYNGFVSY